MAALQTYGGGRSGSGVRAFEAGADFIRVQFADGGIYLYTHGSTGPENIQVMKALAAHGAGLNTYINQHVRGAYQKREK